MRVKIRVFLVLAVLLVPSLARAQSVSLTGTVTDTPDNQTWNGGTISFTFFGPQGTSYRWTGGTLNPNTPITGTLSATGTYSASVPDNSQITPTDSSWIVTVCPAVLPAVSGCFKSNKVITGSSATLNFSPPSPRFTVPLTPGAVSPISGYADSEIAGGWVGFSYYNLVSSSYRNCTTVSLTGCTVWAAGNGINTQNGPGPRFNVKGYGAAGNAQQSVNGNATSSTAFTCSDCNFTQADVGKNIACGLGGSTIVTNTTKIATVTNATTIVLSQAGTGNTNCTVTWGTLDDPAVATAKTAFLSSLHSSAQAGNLGVPSGSNLYFPAGSYFLNSGIRLLTPSPQSGGKLIGDGKDITKLYFTPGASGTNALVEISSNQSNMTISDLTLDGGLGGQSAGNNVAVSVGGSVTVLRDISIQQFGVGGLLLSAPFVQGYNVSVSTNAQSGGSAGIQCNQCSGEFRGGGASNNGNSANLLLNNVAPSSGNYGFRWFGGLIDECGTQTLGCTQIQNSHDVWLMGMGLFGTPTGHCLNVDANSFVHLEGGICGVFGSDTNTGGVSVAAGGLIQSSDVRYISSGTGKCITNSGQFNDNGGNSCESLFTIASGTSTGTAAVLTVNTLGANVNANCSVGDSLIVQNAGIPGYNGYYKAGITAVGTNTISYTTLGSNLGALGGGGSAYCRNLQTFSGTLPVALLNNPIPNTCYITGTFAATTTAAPMCAFKLGSATNINFIKAASTTTTACTVAPVVTITDGTVSETLTITTAKSIWDSSVDASTGVGTTIFKPNGTITLSNTAGTCTTPPTNFSVSYNITPILSN